MKYETPIRTQTKLLKLTTDYYHHDHDFAQGAKQITVCACNDQ